MKSRLAALVLFCVALAAPAAEIPGLTVTPVAIPTPRTVNPYRIGPGSNGRIWFSDVTFRQVGFIAPDGAITAFRLIDSVTINEVRPLAITEGPDGNGWFTVSVTDSSGSPLRNEIGRVTPTGVITRFPTPTVDACTVFGRAPVCGITVGPDGNLWFTETRTKRIGKITLSGEITEYLADGPGGEFFYEITAGPDGNLWVADSQNDIIRITPAGAITTFTRQGLFLARITAGPDGNVWFTDAPSHSIGRITPTGTITLFPTSPTLSPLDIVAGSDGKLYFTEAAADGAQKIGQFDPATGVINESAVTGRGVLGDIVAVSGGSTGGMGIAQTGEFKLAAQSTDPPFENVTIFTIPEPLPATSLEFRKEVDTFYSGPPRLGDTRQFQISIRNGSSAVSNLSVTDTLPPCVEFFGISTNSDFTGKCSFANGVVTCTQTQVAPFEEIPIVILVRVIRQELCVNTAFLSADAAEGRITRASQVEVPPTRDGRSPYTQTIDPEDVTDTSGRMSGFGKKQP